MKKTSVDRREFLTIGSAVVAGVVAAPLAVGRSRAAGQRPALQPILAIGFAAAGTSMVVPASSLGAGRSSSDLLRVTVHGLTESGAGPKHFVRLTTFFEREGLSRPFLAWGSGASRVNFTIPAAGPIAFGLEREAASGPRLTQDATDVPDLASLSRKAALFTLGAEVGFAEGTYVVALRTTAGDALPDWGSMTLDRERLSAGAEHALLRSEKPVAFDHLMFSIQSA